MKTLLLAFCVCLSAAVAVAQDDPEIGVRAPSSVVNCECQCHHYTWVDARGQTQGNCKSPDQTGARWCYIPENARYACSDVRVSKNRFDQRGRPRPWSYEACSTPVCGGGFGGGPRPPIHGNTGGFTPAGQSGVFTGQSQPGSLASILGVRDASGITNAEGEAAPAEDSAVAFEQR